VLQEALVSPVAARKLHAADGATRRRCIHARGPRPRASARYGFIVTCPRSSPPGKFFECTFT
jgi:hypothetical protein